MTIRPLRNLRGINSTGDVRYRGGAAIDPMLSASELGPFLITPHKIGLYLVTAL